MIYILITALIFMMLTSLILLRNRFEFKSINSISSGDQKNLPKVSICVPARNEEAVIKRCVTSLLNQDYPNFEVIVLDDNSEDSTPNILKDLSNQFPELKVIKGDPKPDEWLGKPWACHQLSEQATGTILVFLDADVWIEPDVIQQVSGKLKSFDVLTIWPQQKVITFFEKLVVPTIYYSLLTLLPAIYVERSPKWMPGFLRPKLNQKFTAACGQFIAFNKTVYDSFGGHRAVKHEVVEDMELARIVKRRSYTLSMMNGIESVYCRMYTSGPEIWSGLQKNFLAGFGNIFEFIFMAALHLLFFLFPIYALIDGLISGDQLKVILSAGIITAYILQRFLLNLWFGWNWWMALLHPFAVLWYQILGLKCLVNKLFGFKTTWKGRSV